MVGMFLISSSILGCQQLVDAIVFDSLDDTMHGNLSEGGLVEYVCAVADQLTFSMTIRKKNIDFVRRVSEGNAQAQRDCRKARHTSSQFYNVSGRLKFRRKVGEMIVQ